MRRSRSTLVSLSYLSALLSILIAMTSVVNAAATPDRIVSNAASSQFVKLPAGVPAKAQPEFDRGSVDPSLKLNYMTLLTVPSTVQQKAMSRLSLQQHDPNSALFQKWLTPEQYADRFGLSQSDINKLTSWLKSQGFVVENVARGRNWIAFSGTAAQVENAFQTTLHYFEINGERHFANTTAPSIPSAFSGIVTGIRGLSSFRPKSYIQRRSPAYTEPTTQDLFVAPGDIATMYDLGPLYTAGFDGSGQKLAVVGRTDVYLADLNDFRTAFGLSSITCTTNSNNVITACNDAHFKYVLNGPDPGVNPFSPDDDLPEADIDLEWSGATARNAQIVYVNSGGTSGDVFDAYYYAIDNNVAPVVSMSYGFCEFDEAQSGNLLADENEFAKANTEGITFLNSSGDDGAAACDFNPPNSNPPFDAAVGGLGVSYPASSPHVTAVGGTMIPIGEYSSTYWGPTNTADGGSALSYIPENGWNDDAEIGAFCAANPTSSNCNPRVGVAITNQQTAQEDFWISSTGGGASNCTTISVSSICTGGFAKPSYQTVTVPSQASARFVPDVSLLASANFPGYLVCTAQFELNGGTNTASSCAVSIVDSINTYGSIFGGTSVSTPVFAGIVTLLNQYLAGSSSPGLGNINPKLYSLAISTPAAFHPVTAGLNTPGSNIVYCQPGTPAGQPANVKCPVGGSMGFLAANADATTGYNLVTGLGSVDANVLAIAWAASRAVSSLSILAAPTQVILGQNVNLTATVSPSTASGTISFFVNGSTSPIGTAKLSGGVAVLSTTALPLGIDHITASFPGDGNNLASQTATSATVTITAPDFGIANLGNTSATVSAGVSATYTFRVTPAAPATTFPANVTFGCSGLPDPTVTCNFSTNPIPAGAAATSETLTITTAGPNTAGGSVVKRHAENRLPHFPMALPLAGILMVGFAGRRFSKYSAITGVCLTLVLGLLIACGGGGNSAPPPVSVSVTGTPSSVYPNNTGWPTQTAQFTATVSNTTNTAVTWAVSPSNGGTISATGLYTAPTLASGLPTSVAITATSAADPTKSGSAQETLKAATTPGSYSVTVNATEATTSHTVGPYALAVH